MKQFLSTKYNDLSTNLGLLILRLVFGGLMIHVGYDKLTHFAERAKGINMIFGSPTDGVLLVFAEFFCAILLVLGLFTRFALIPLIIAMAVAFFKAHNGVLFGENNGQTAFIYLMAYVALLFTGPGKYSADRAIFK